MFNRAVDLRYLEVHLPYIYDYPRYIATQKPSIRRENFCSKGGKKNVDFFWVCVTVASIDFPFLVSAMGVCKGVCV